VFGTAVFTKGNQNHIAVSVRSYSEYTSFNNPWDGAGDRTFSSKPACVSLDYDERPHPLNHQIAAIAKSGSQNRYYLGVLKLGTSPTPFVDPPGPPTMLRTWAQVSSDSFASAPAVTIYNGSFYLVGRKADNSVVILHGALNLDNVTDPYAGITWQAAMALPALPSGWVATGDPSIASSKYGVAYPVVAIRAVKDGVTRIYHVARQHNVAHGPWGSWERFDIGTLSVASDVSLEANGAKTQITAYFRATDNRIYQSTHVLGSTTWETFKAIGSDKFVGNPNGVGGSLGTDPTHMVYAKKEDSNEIWLIGTKIGVP
jgi:hypothetical protein